MRSIYWLVTHLKRADDSTQSYCAWANYNPVHALATHKGLRTNAPIHMKIKAQKLADSFSKRLVGQTCHCSSCRYAPPPIRCPTTASRSLRRSTEHFIIWRHLVWQHCLHALARGRQSSRSGAPGLQRHGLQSRASYSQRFNWLRGFWRPRFTRPVRCALANVFIGLLIR